MDLSRRVPAGRHDRCALRSGGLHRMRPSTRRRNRENIAAGTRTVFGQHRWERRTPLPVTESTPTYQKRAEQKRVWRRARNLRVTWRAGYVFKDEEMLP